MTNSPRQGATLAVLIDADNAAPAIVEGLLAEVAKYGVAAVKRIYGDWTRPNLSGWKDRLLAHSIQPIQQFRYTVGKNATDSAMIIDAMDLLYTGRFDGFCIVSSDSDFTRLASRIREQGLTVYGFGERKTPKPFVTACDKFIYSDVLRATDTDSDAEAETAPARRRSSQELRQDSRLVRLLQSASQAMSDEDGWSTLGGIGNYIAKQAPEFDSRNYGYGKLSELVTATNLFDVETRNGGNNKTLWVRLKKRGKGEGGQPQPSQPQSQPQQQPQQSQPQPQAQRPAHVKPARAPLPTQTVAQPVPSVETPAPVVEVNAIPEPAPAFSAADEESAGSASTLISEEVAEPQPKPGKRSKRPEVTLSDTPWPIDQSVFAAPGTTVLPAKVKAEEEVEEAPAPVVEAEADVEAEAVSKVEAPAPAKKKPAAKKAAPRKRAPAKKAAAKE
ncbi:NYN domain-containing protein [Cupriavidus pauculus]|uniref:NYN domain-containing protein n=1 Tax=Cupriavidus pauculus TaxID=82633 RepID=UPI001EE203C4|nr:NYN domain-containing protein [Cupriavidus pauculus]GJG97005.1 NYN domain-containing protein [Cupriavidus pauculus]